MGTPAHLKLELAVSGLRLAPELASEPGFARPTTARDFASREIEIVLPEDIVAQCPISPSMSANSPFELGLKNDRFLLIDSRSANAEPTPVSVIPAPQFYNLETSLGTPMWKIGTVQAGYISIDPSTSCGFATKDAACKFCTLSGSSPKAPEQLAEIEDVVEVVRAAFDEGAAEFVYFNTGYFDRDDGGFEILAPYIEAVKKHVDTLVAVQSHPPRQNKWIDRIYAAGVDALSYSIEIYDPDILRELCRGRSEFVGRERYYEALDYAVTIFPSGTVWSDLVVGLEPPESTIAGIDKLTEMGVLPVLSLFRPLEESGLADVSPPDPASVAPIYAHLYTAVKKAGLNVQFMRDLGYAVTPIEARFFAGDDARLDVAVSSFYRTKIGSRAVRGLSKLRRRLRVKRVSESFDSAKL